MVHWNSSPHPISDIRDWSTAKHLELRPDFQRRAVWSIPARIMLMDTILRDIPMPKIFLANTVRDDRTYRVVIDGQQRISAILDFLRDHFTLDYPYVGNEQGKKFSELDRTTKDNFLSYQIDFNEAVNPTDEEVRDVYTRVNKYTVPLNKQELRRADFPGDFLTVSEELAEAAYFEITHIFTLNSRRRYADVEYLSELLAAMIDGVQDEKATLDSFYINYSSWDKNHRERIEDRFAQVIHELQFIFNDDLDIAKTRFRQKADFYTLFIVICEFVSDGRTVCDKDISALQKDLKLLSRHIRPESAIRICSEYAVKCVSQANSASSRRWRHLFLRSILAGTYIGKQTDDVGRSVYYGLMDGITLEDCEQDLYCPPSPDNPTAPCEGCYTAIDDDLDNCVIAWHKSEPTHQLSNSVWFHSSCIKDTTDWLFLRRPSDDQPNLF